MRHGKERLELSGVVNRLQTADRHAVLAAAVRLWQTSLVRFHFSTFKCIKVERKICFDQTSRRNVYFQMCQPLQQHTAQNCQGAVACQNWPGENAALGSFNTVSYSDASTFDGVVVRADDVSVICGGASTSNFEFVLNCFSAHFAKCCSQGTPANGIARSLVLNIKCANVSDPYPMFVHEVDGEVLLLLSSIPIFCSSLVFVVVQYFHLLPSSIPIPIFSSSLSLSLYSTFFSH